MYVCKVIGKIISTVKNEKLVGHSIVLVQAAALNDRGSLEADGCGEGNFVLVTRGSNARYACKCAEAPVDMAVVGILDGGQWGLS